MVVRGDGRRDMSLNACSIAGLTPYSFLTDFFSFAVGLVLEVGVLGVRVGLLFGCWGVLG